MAIAQTYVPIATQTLSSPTPSITFSSIPQNYTDLILVANTYSTTTSYGALTSLIGLGNGSVDTGSNYSYTNLIYLNNTNNSTLTTSSGTVPNITTAAFLYAGTAYNGSNNWSTCVAHIMNYSNTNTYKTILARDSVPAGFAVGGVSVNLWRNTAAINIITITLNVGQNYATGSQFTLYGIKAA